MAHAFSHIKLFLLFIFFVGTHSACTSDNAADVPETISEQTGNIIEVKEMEWTYYSLEKGQVIGSSAFGDSDADSLWKHRQDWDFAICGDMIRTNSGTSGIGQGGLIATDRPYDQLGEAPAADYTEDQVW